MPHSLSPSPKPGALADELAITAMVRALRGLSDFDLSDQRIRAIIYLDAGIPLHHVYKHDPAALKMRLPQGATRRSSGDPSCSRISGRRRMTKPRESATIELGLIAGVSQYNPRTIDANGIDELAASLLASGQLQPLLVTIEDESYAVLDGQRRWQAMRRLAEEGHWTLQHPVAVELLHLPEPALREIGLAANTMRRQLHPVEEYRAFDALNQAGASEDAIAKDFGLSIRHIRQRLALGRLAPGILDAWLAGKIDAEEAQAFTIRDSHAAQTAAFEKLFFSTRALNAYEIRKALQSDALPSNCKEAKYVGAEAYISAGGAIREDLFSEESLFLDGTLLKDLAAEKLLAEGNAIAEREGWGFVAIDGQCKFDDFDIDRTPPAYLPDEKLRLDEIETHGSDYYEDAAEIEELESRAYLRAVPAEKRNRMGVFLQLDDSGPFVTRGLVEKRKAISDDKTESAPFAVGGASKGAAAASSPAAAPASQDLSKTARQILDVAIEDGFYNAIRNRPDLPHARRRIARVQMHCVRSID